MSLGYKVKGGYISFSWKPSQPLPTQKEMEDLAEMLRRHDRKKKDAGKRGKS